MTSKSIAKPRSGCTAPLRDGRTRTCPLHASTSYPLPTIFEIVLHFAGDSTTSSAGPVPPPPAASGGGGGARFTAARGAAAAAAPDDAAASSRASSSFFTPPTLSPRALSAALSCGTVISDGVDEHMRTKSGPFGGR